MDLRVSRSVLEALAVEAALAEPDECCGLLLGQGVVIDASCAAANVAADTRRRFEIDPQKLIKAHRAARQGGPGVIGYYHSHPGGEAKPSATDCAEAARDGSVWAIIGQSGVTFWRDEEAGFAALSYAVEDR